MPGNHRHQAAMVSCAEPEGWVPNKHPLRMIRTILDQVLSEISTDFSRMYTSEGRFSMPPWQLLCSLVLYSVPRERLFIQQLDHSVPSW